MGTVAELEPPVAALLDGATRIDDVVLFFEILLIVAVVVITWFAVYAVYRLVTDELSQQTTSPRSLARRRSPRVRGVR